MNVELRENEQPVRKGRANLQRGIEVVGGRLYLTNQRLIFAAHRFNIQTGKTIIELAHVTRTQKGWTRFLGFIPLFPNTLAVFTEDGHEYRFVLTDREAWAMAIEKQLGLGRAP